MQVFSGYFDKYGEDGELERPAQLTDREIGFIVDWLRGDWYEPSAWDESPAEGSATTGEKQEESLPVE